MVELSLEEKAKAYDEALEKARQLCAYPTTKPFISDLQDLFPELKESDDERIRKHLIGIVELYYGKTDEQEKKDCLAWLEKQGELVNSLSKGLDNAHERIDVLIQKNNSLIEQLEKKQGEKPKEHNVCDSCDQQGACVEPCCVKLVEKQGEQILANSAKTCKDEQKPVWSEEDEKMLDKMRDYFMRFLGDKPDFTDDKRYEGFVEFIDHRLKSLRPRSHWKPSKEQMKALYSAASCHVQHDADLCSLYNDLEKLTK